MNNKLNRPSNEKDVKITLSIQDKNLDDEENILNNLYEKGYFETTNVFHVGHIKKREIKVSRSYLKKTNEEEEIWEIYEMLDSYFIVTQRQQLYAIGKNIYGELGIPDRKQIDFPTRVDLTLKYGEGIDTIFRNYYSTFIVTSTSTVYACGKNNDGMLGVNSRDETICIPTRVPLTLNEGEGIKNIYNCFASSFIVTTSSRIFGSGWNHKAQLGINIEMEKVFSPHLIPIPLKIGETIELIYCDSFSTFFQTSHSHLYTCGWNKDGQLGIETDEKYIYSPTLVPISLENGEMITSLISENGSTFISTTNSRVFAWGKNNDGQLGISSRDKNIYMPGLVSLTLMKGEKIKSIYYNKNGSTFYITTFARIFSCGSNVYGELGVQSQDEYINEPKNLSLPLQKGEEIKFVYCSSHSTYIVTTLERIFTCGWNDAGQLGLNSKLSKIFKPTMLLLALKTNEKIIKIFCNYGSSFITTSLRLFAAGLNKNGQLGINSVEKNIYVPTLVPFPTKYGIMRYIYCNYGSTFMSTSGSIIYRCGVYEE